MSNSSPNVETALGEVLSSIRGISNPWKAVDSVIVATILAYYLPVLFVTLFGYDRNWLWLPEILFPQIAVMTIQAVIMSASRKPILAGVAIASVWTFVFFASNLHTQPLNRWMHWWPDFLCPGVATLFEGYLVDYFQRLFGFEYKKRPKKPQTANP